MSSQTPALRIAGFLFAVFCLGHVWRLFAHINVQIGSHNIPMWPSVIAAIVAGMLSLWMWTASGNKNR